jgi:dimethylargininase
MNSAISFSGAIVRTPCRSIVDGVTTAQLGKPDHENAIRQHSEYIKTLEHCGLHATVMPPAEQYPDSVFVEDCAVLTDKCAVIANTGVTSRQGEETSVHDVLKNTYKNIYEIHKPGMLEGGDVLRVHDHFYIGQTARTNKPGIEQLTTILQDFGYAVTMVPVSEMLHLKTGVAFLGDDTVVLSGELIDCPAFGPYRKIIIDQEEAYAANCVRINEYVVMPAGYHVTRRALQHYGYKVIEVDVSEFRKVDGGISCLSLRIPLTVRDIWR